MAHSSGAAAPAIESAPVAEPASLFTRTASETLIRDAASSTAPAPVAGGVDGGFQQAMGDALYARTLSTLLLAQIDRDERYGI